MSSTRDPSISYRSSSTAVASPKGPSGDKQKSLVIIQSISTKEPVNLSPDRNLATPHEREHREEVKLKTFELVLGRVNRKHAGIYLSEIDEEKLIRIC